MMEYYKLTIWEKLIGLALLLAIIITNVL